MTIKQISNLKQGDKIKEVKISSGWSELNKEYVVNKVFPNENTESEFKKFKFKEAIPSSVFDKMLFNIRNKIPSIVYFGGHYICSGNGVMNNFEKV